MYHQLNILDNITEYHEHPDVVTDLVIRIHEISFSITDQVLEIFI